MADRVTRNRGTHDHATPDDGAVQRVLDRQDRRDAAMQRDRAARKAEPGYEGTRKLVTEDIDDPYAPVGSTLKRKTQPATRNARHDPIEQLYHQKDRKGRRLIGPGERVAGAEIRRLVEAVGLDAVKSLDYSAVRAACGGGKGDLSARRMDAHKRLGRLAERLGEDQFNLVVAVAGYGKTITMAAIDFEDDETQRANGACAKGTRESVGWMFRRSLRKAADELGYGVAHGPERSKGIRASRA